MGIKKKMTTIFSQKTNSRRDKRKEKKKQQKTTSSSTDLNQQPGCSKWTSDVESPARTPEPDTTRLTPDVDSSRGDTPDIKTPPKTPEPTKQTTRPKTGKRPARPKTGKQKAVNNNNNNNNKTVKRTVSNETITLVRPFSVGSGISSCSELTSDDGGSSCCTTPSTVPSSPRHYSDFEDDHDDGISCASSRRHFSPDDVGGDGDDNISTISIYSVASSDGARSRILPRTPPKNPPRTFSGMLYCSISSQTLKP